VDSLQPMRIFVSVVQNGSLSSAGRQLGLSPASVSRHLSGLEESLGCRLVNRTSRKLTLTEAGELYFAKVEQILHQVAEANDSVAQLQSLPRGTLRVHSRMLIGHLFVVPALPTFLAQNPEVKVDLLLSNRVVDLVEQNIDIDIRIGKLVDSSLVAKRLAVSERILCGAPEYFENRPAPQSKEYLCAKCKGPDAFDGHRPSRWVQSIAPRPPGPLHSVQRCFSRRSCSIVPRRVLAFAGGSRRYPGRKHRDGTQIQWTFALCSQGQHRRT
jgi:DNA-binding transcriptional LysR family regulator